MDRDFQDFGEILVYTPCIGFGDLLYHTPLFRMLARAFNGVDVWSFNPEPLFYNPDLKNIFQIDSEKDPNPVDFYHDKVFHVAPERNFVYNELFQSNMHMTDYFTVGSCGLVLRDFEKTLSLTWLPEHEEKVAGLLQSHDLKPGEFVVVNPALGWPSRTLSLETYQEVIGHIQANGDKVVIVGKDVSGALCLPDGSSDELVKRFKNNEDKKLYDVEDFPGAIDFTNILNFHESCCLYSFAKMAVNTENGNMVMSCTNDNCWNLYIPSLTAPEFRLPHRQGSMFYRTYVAHHPRNYYPGSDYSLLRRKRDVINIHTDKPTVGKIIEGYEAICTAVKNNHNFILAGL
jgi:hypothetical protein